MTHKWKYVCLIIAHSATGIGAAAGTADGDLTLDGILQQHEQATVAITSFACDFKTYNLSGDGRVVESRRYYWSPRGVALHGGRDAADRLVFANGKMTSRSRRPAIDPLAWNVVLRPARADSVFEGNVWPRSLLRLSTDGGKATLSVPAFCVAHRKDFDSVRRETAEGATYAVARFRYRPDGLNETVTDELWFAEGRNYLLARRQRAAQANYRTETVDRFVEPIHGIFFPAQTSERSRIDGVERAGVILRNDNIVINGPIPPAAFDESIPARAMVYDEIAGRRYQTDANGQQTGKAESLARTPSLINPPRAATARPPATQGEEQSWPRFLLPAGVLILAGTATLWLVRRWREFRNAPH